MSIHSSNIQSIYILFISYILLGFLVIYSIDSLMGLLMSTKFLNLCRNYIEFENIKGICRRTKYKIEVYADELLRSMRLYIVIH